MEITIRRMGNSQGVLIPKPLLQQLGLEDRAEMRIEGDALVLRKPRPALRAGWAEASQQIVASGEDALLMPEFPNEADEDWTW
jgi:antitoxin MazE